MSTINLTSHGLGGGERVVFYNVVPTGTGLDEDVIYTVLVTGLTADTFQVSETGEEDDPLTLALNVTSASMAIVPETTTSDPEDPSYVAVTDPADVHAPPEAITEPQQPVLASDTDTGVVRITITLVAPTDPRIKAVELQVTDEYAVPASAPDAPDFTNAQTLSLMPSTTTFSVRAHPLTTYSARVRHLDIYGNASDWTIPFYGANASIETVAGYDSLNSTITSALDHQIDTVEIKDNAITAPLLAGTIVLGSTIIAGDPDADRVEMNVDGIILYDAAGQPVVVIPTDGVSPVSVKGEVEASTLTSTTSAEFNDTVSLAGGATMTAQSVVTAPIAVPTLTSGWESGVTLTPGGGRGFAWTMDYTASGGAGGATKVIYAITSGGSGYYLEEYLASTGASNRAVLITSSLTPMGLAVHGSNVYVTVSTGSAVDVYVYAISSLTKTTTYSAISNPGDSLVCVIASDGTNLYCAAPNSGTSTTRYSKYDSSMSLVSGPTSLTGSTTADPWDMKVGSFDFGATRILLHPATGGTVRSWNTSGTEQTAEAFPTATSVADFFYGDVDGTGARFWSRDSATLTKHTNWTWGGGGTQAWRVGYAWYLSTGPYETVMGPTGSITTYQRKRLTVANAAIPGGADQVRVYMYPSASAPAAGSSWLQVTDANTTRYITSYTNSGTNDKTSSTFSGGTPAVIQSSGSEWVLSGNGSVAFATTVTPGGKPPVVRTYTSSTSWSKPTGLSHIIVEVQGGGGGAGGAPTASSNQAASAGGGGGGGYARKLLTAADLTASSYTVTVGTGGSGGSAGANDGVNGNPSYFVADAGDSWSSVTGGGGALGDAGINSAGHTIVAGGAGGGGSNGDVNVTGSDGANGLTVGGATASGTFRAFPASGGNGGGSHLGGLARGNPADGGGAGGTGSLYGGGGSGAHTFNGTSAQAGGDGANGIVIVTEYYGA